MRNLTHCRQPAAESLTHQLEQALIGGDLLLGNCDARLISPDAQVGVRGIRRHGNPCADLLGNRGVRLSRGGLPAAAQTAEQVQLPHRAQTCIVDRLVTVETGQGAGDLAYRALQGIVDSGRLAVHIESWQELRTGLTGRCPSLLDSRQCRRKIEVLITRPLHDAREHRVVEAIPPGFEGRRGSACRASREGADTVEVLERRRAFSIRRADGTT